LSHWPPRPTPAPKASSPITAPNSEFVLAFYEGDRRAHVQLDGKALALSRRPSFSGPRYGRGDVTLTIGKTALTLKRGKRTTTCAKTD